MGLTRDQWVDTNYHKYWDILYLYSCNITRDKEVAADVVQEVYVSIWNNYNNLSIDNPKAYLLRAVRNKSLKSLQSIVFDTVQLEEAFIALVDNEVLSEEEEILFKEQLLKMIYHKAEEILPAKCYHIFILRYSNRLSYKEIASTLDISERTVDNQICKALKCIKTSLPYTVDFVVVIGFLMILP